MPENRGLRFNLTQVMIICNLLLLASTAYLLYDKYKPITPENYLKSGDFASGFDATDSEGMPVQIEFKNKAQSTLLLVFTTTCPTCQATLKVWNEIASKNSSIRCLGVSLDGPEKTIPFTYEHKLAFGFVLTTNKEFIRSYQIHSVPVAVLIDGNGRIVDSWAGALSEDAVDQINESIGG